jgi:hypothetical protein
MRLVKVLGATLVGVFAISAVAVMGASAHQFEVNSAPALVLVEADGPQLFITLAGHVVCNTLRGHGIVAAFPVLALNVTVSYTGCTATGVANLTAKPDEPITGEYELSADGTVRILRDITILASFAGTRCTILVLPQGPLASVSYDNIIGPTGHNEILKLAHIKNILNHATGAGCRETYADSTTGLYKGNSIIFVDGGDIEWV